MTLSLIGNSHGIRHYEFPLLKLQTSNLEGGAVPTKVRALHDDIMNVSVLKISMTIDTMITADSEDLNNVYQSMKTSRNEACAELGRWRQTTYGYLHDLFLMQSMQTLSMFLCRMGLTNSKIPMRT